MPVTPVAGHQIDSRSCAANFYCCVANPNQMTWKLDAWCTHPGVCTTHRVDQPDKLLRLAPSQPSTASGATSSRPSALRQAAKAAAKAPRARASDSIILCFGAAIAVLHLLHALRVTMWHASCSRTVAPTGASKLSADGSRPRAFGYTPQ